jgi:hypothetical protein
MSVRRVVLAGAAALLLASPMLAQGPRQDGRWQVTMEMSMPGMPAGMPPITTEQCLTPEDVKNPQAIVPQNQGRGRGRGNQQCSVSDYKMSGNKATWSMKCDGDTSMTGTGEMTYDGDSYIGLMNMNMNMNGQPMAMTMKMAGKRLGDCVR